MDGARRDDRRREASPSPDAAGCRAIGLVALGGEPGADSPEVPGLLLDDFAAALAAYERVSSRGLGAELARWTRFVRATMPCAAKADEELGACESVAAACHLGRDGDLVHTKEALMALMALTDALGAAGGGIYLIAAVDGEADDGVAKRIEDEAARALGDAGRLAGCVVIGYGSLLPRLWRTPRLGMWRRPVAEAIDALVAAVRMGAPLVNPLSVEPHRLWLRLQGLHRNRDGSRGQGQS